jgi:hypothetical protein
MPLYHLAALVLLALAGLESSTQTAEPAAPAAAPDAMRADLTPDDFAPAAPPARVSRAPYLEIDQGGATRFCTNPTSEILDASSSSPRLILWADCGDERFSVVARPTSLPGKPPVQIGRFAQMKSGEEWSSTAGDLDVTEFGAVGGNISGELDLTMSERLNRPAEKIHVRFVAPRAADRSSP